jgi:putative hemolysin
MSLYATNTKLSIGVILKLDDPASSSFPVALLILLLLGLSALCSGAETAFLSLGPVRVRQMTERGNRRANIIRDLLSNIDRLLSTLLVGNTIVNIFLTSLITSLFLINLRGFSKEAAEVSATIVSTILLLVFGEITPKTIAAYYPMEWSTHAALPMKLMRTILTPLVWILDFVTKAFHRIFRDEESQVADEAVTEETIKTAVALVEEEGNLKEEKKDMIYRIFENEDTPVSRIMVPRDSIVALRADAKVPDAVRVIFSVGFSRIPLYEGSINNIVGIVYAKDLLTLLREGNKDVVLREIKRQPYFCSPDKSIRVLLQELQNRRVHMCFIRDSKGKILGLVTLEDLLEAIVGDITDEHDNHTTAVEAWRARGVQPQC